MLLRLGTRGSPLALVQANMVRDALLARKQELMSQAEAGGLPPAEPRAVRLQPA